MAPSDARPIRVCFISPLGYGLYNEASGVPFGGAEVQFALLSRELARDPAYDVCVLVTVTGESGTERRDNVTIIKRTAGGRRAPDPDRSWLEAPARWRGYLSALFEMFRLFKTIDADVYIHGGAGVELGAYALICRLLGRPLAYVVMSTADLDEPWGNVAGPLKRLFPFGLRLAHTIVCETEDQCASLEARYGRRGVLIRTGHEIPDRLPAGAEEGKKSGVLWVGRCLPLKQPEVFLDLAARVPNESCDMLVMRDNEHPDLWQRVWDRGAAMPNVTLHRSPVPWAEVNRLFANAKLFVSTSTYEGFPNTFVQAAMAATPVLSLNVDPDRVLTKHRIGFCAGGSFERLAAEAERLCAAEPERAAMGRRAWTYAREHHDLHRVAGALQELVRTLAGRGAV
jgi:glycosyltransferase involved in cell wall biosynthesis